MSDVVTYTEDGRTYRVSGLAAKAESISGAASEMDTLISDRISAANDALADWKGVHAGTFADDVNDVLSKMAGLKIALSHASSVLSAFPEAPYTGTGQMYYIDAIYGSARVQEPTSDTGTAAATPSKLRTYSTTSGGQDGRFSTLADMVNLDDVTAEVSYFRDLTAGEQQDLRDQGIPDDDIARETRQETEPFADVASLIPLPTPKPDVPPLVTASEGVAEFSTAVAIAFENADENLLALLADYPDLAGFIVGGLPDGRVSGESSLAILLAYFAEFDTAGHGGDADGIVSLDDLEAMLSRYDLPNYVREAAQYLIDNPVLFGLAETVNDRGDVLGQLGDGEISVEDIETFLAFNDSLRTVEQNFDAFDVADDGGDGDGRVSINDLEAIAAGTGPLAEAARWLLDHDVQRERLANYDLAKQTGAAMVDKGGDPGIFTRNSVIGLAADGQIYGDDPAAARAFVNRLPVAEDGNEGIPIWLVSDEGAINLANAALIDTGGDLTDSHSVIAHLPETTGGVRNTLITGYYDLLAQRADGLFAGDVAGDPRAPGHPGANWLLYAPWASNGVHDVITGDFSVFGISPGMTDRQAAADGNQWIFNDIGARYAAFVEMYEGNPNPSEAELESFFSTNFDEGDGTIRTGFSAYVAAMEETDPARQQELLFQGNTMVATHEQAGVQPYLEEISTGPDNITVRYIDVTLGNTTLDVDKDVPATNLANNFIDDANILDLDPGGTSSVDYRASGPGATQFSENGTYGEGVVDMRPISGVNSWDDEFPTSTRDMWEGGTGTDVTMNENGELVFEHPDPDSQTDSDASSWPDRSERMWYILKLFEQHHTDPQLYRTDEHDLNLDDIPWLDSATGLG